MRKLGRRSAVLALVIVGVIVAAFFFASLTRPRPVRTIEVLYSSPDSVYDMAKNSTYIVVGTVSETAQLYAVFGPEPPTNETKVLPYTAYNLSISILVNGNWTRNYIWVLTLAGEVEYDGVIYVLSEEVAMPVQTVLIVFITCPTSPPPPNRSIPFDLEALFGYQSANLCYLSYGPSGYYDVIGGLVRLHAGQAPQVTTIDGLSVDGMALEEFIGRISS